MKQPSDPPISRSDEPRAAPERTGERPLVSIVIPCFNNEAYVAEAIDSALGQTYDNIEVIVIDDGSTDGSLDIIHSYGDRIIWRTGPNEGACAARNRALDLATGEYVKFLDGDDTLVAECIAVQVEQSDGQPMSVIVFGDHVRVYADNTPMPMQQSHNLSDGEFASLAWIFLPGPRISSPLYPRVLLEKVDGFCMGLPRGQEHDLNLRLALAGARFLYKPTKCLLQRFHGSPFRISNQIPPGGFANRFDGPEPVYEFLSEARSITSDAEYRLLTIVVAHNCWKRGRASLCHDDYEMASIMFKLARSLSPNDYMAGGRLYRALCRLLGPWFAERVGLLYFDAKKLSRGKLFPHLTMFGQKLR